MKHYSLILLFLFVVTKIIQGQSIDVSFVPGISEPYSVISGKFTGNVIPQSPDPLVGYKWEKTTAEDNLEIYYLHPQSISSVFSNNVQFYKSNKMPIKVVGTCDLMFDFGQENAGWLEFDSDDFDGKVEMSISEYNEPAILNKGAQNRIKTMVPIKYGSTYRLELNDEFYEGVRFGWIHIRSLNKPCTIKDVRLVCQVKPTNYLGSFSCSDTTLTRIWYTGAYAVKLNFQKKFFGAILMERSDRFSWTGDAYPAQAASMVAFGNYDFVRDNIIQTSTKSNGIVSYPVYWVLSLVDYCNYTGDKATLNVLLDKALTILDDAYAHFGRTTGLGFNGWDERLGAGFEDADCKESQYVYCTLSIQAWKEFGQLMKKLGRDDLAKKYDSFVDEKINDMRQQGNWVGRFGIHAASNIVNAGVIQPTEGDVLWESVFSDRLQRLSYSPFNQFFIIKAMAKLGRYKEALTTIDDCWGGQLRYGGTSFFEVYRPSWNEILGRNGAPVNNQCGYVSLCHPWSSGVTKWLTEEILGIKPTTPGFATFSVKPQIPTEVGWVKGTVPTPQGIVELLCDTKTGNMILTVPLKTSASVGIPKTGKTISYILVNGKKINPVKEDNDFYYIGELPAGHYNIKFQPNRKVVPMVKESFIYLYQPASEDTVTQGNWKSKYGNKGYVLCDFDSIKGNHKKLPDFIASVDFRLNGDVHFSNAKNDSRALMSDMDNVEQCKLGAIITRDPNACLQTMTVDISCKKDEAYQVALYMVDWEKEGRRSAIEVFDLNNKALLMPVTMVKEYQNGKYIVFDVDRSVRIRINHVRGSNASLSALFID